MKVPGFEHMTRPVAIAIMFAIVIVGLIVNVLSGPDESSRKAKPSAAVRLAE